MFTLYATVNACLRPVPRNDTRHHITIMMNKNGECQIKANRPED